LSDGRRCCFEFTSGRSITEESHFRR
jgi:hypothetical protein